LYDKILDDMVECSRY